MNKKLISFVFAILIIFSSITFNSGSTQATISRTMDEVRAWLDNEAAMQNVYNNGECTWFCNHYLVDFWGENGIYGVGNANGWVDHCPPNWTNTDVDGNADNFRMGDLIVEVYPPNGHVMVYYGKGSDGRHYVVDHNFQFNGHVSKHIWYEPLSQETYCYRPPITVVSQPSKPEIIETATCINTWFQWRPCENTLSYDVRVYRDGATEPFTYLYGVSSTYCSFNLENGTYQMNVAAVNRIGDDWAWSFSDKVTFTVNKITDFVPQKVEVWNGHTYSLYDYGFVSWIEAKDFCENNGGYLAVVTSQAENNFIHEMLQDADHNKCWLGGTELNLPSWQWITGEPFSYTNWNDGEPNNAWGIEHYIGMYRDSGRWNDFRTVQSAICLIMETDSAQLLGDVNGDGEVDISDALMTMRGAMGIIQLTADQQAAADVNGDGNVDVSDALLIMRCSMGIIPAL